MSFGEVGEVGNGRLVRALEDRACALGFGGGALGNFWIDERRVVDGVAGIAVFGGSVERRRLGRCRRRVGILRQGAACRQRERDENRQNGVDGGLLHVGISVI